MRDRGPGIPRDFAPHAFDPFARADAARAGPGAGLGLAIVAAVATAHDGRVGFHDAEPGTDAVLTWRRQSTRRAISGYVTTRPASS